MTLILLLIAVNLLAQAPLVSNVRLEQRTDGSLITDIRYNLSYSGANPVGIFIEASGDNGSTWTLPCDHLTGDVNQIISPGTDKHIVWDFVADNPNISGSQFKVRVTADDNVMVGNDGRLYRTVQIGDQWWMAENLRETEYQNGDVISEDTNYTTWSNLSTAARCVYNNNESLAGTYGYLYNWYAAVDTRQVAPEGWHVPSRDELRTLRSTLAPMDPWCYVSEAGGKLKEQGTSHWLSPNYGATNQVGFTGLPTGWRFNVGHFMWLGAFTKFWTSTNISDDWAYAMELNYSNTGSEIDPLEKKYGFPLRLIKN